MSFKIKITDNDDGVVLYDIDDADVILGAFSKRGENPSGIILASCDAITYAGQRMPYTAYIRT